MSDQSRKACCLRNLIAVGVVAILIGFVVASMAEGLGGPAPSVREARAWKAAGAVAILSGAALAMGSAIALYVIGRRSGQ